jgi:peptidoglycan-associated lipoprotein
LKNLGGFMKKFLFVLIALSLILLFNNCGKKAVKTAPAAGPVVEEIFQQKTIEDLNKDGIMKKINFDFDEYQVREDMKPIMQANADWMLKFSTVQVLIEGHCDERGTIEYNIALGEKRAEAAKNYLASLGVNAAKIKIVSYGKSKTLVQGMDEASYFQNRRAEFVITKK